MHQQHYGSGGRVQHPRFSLSLSLNPGVRTARGETDDWGGGNGGPIHDKNVILYQPCYTVGPVT